MVKEFLTQRGVTFQERDVSRNAAYAAELVRNTGQRGVPVTIIDGKMVIGYDPAQLEPLLKLNKQRPPFGASIADAGKITAKLSTGITLGAYVGSVKPGSIAGWGSETGRTRKRWARVATTNVASISEKCMPAQRWRPAPKGI